MAAAIENFLKLAVSGSGGSYSVQWAVSASTGVGSSECGLGWGGGRCMSDTATVMVSLCQTVVWLCSATYQLPLRNGFVSMPQRVFSSPYPEGTGWDRESEFCVCTNVSEWMFPPMFSFLNSPPYNKFVLICIKLDWILEDVRRNIHWETLVHGVLSVWVSV